MSDNATVYKQLIGKTFSIVDSGGDTMRFVDKDGKGYEFHHDQSCCESVEITDIIGDLKDLIDSPILQAEEVISTENAEYESCTWTFYKFATIKGSVTVRWMGTSNGYYSESVDFREI